MKKKELQTQLAEMTRPPGGFAADHKKWRDNLLKFCADIDFQPLLVGIDWNGSPERIAQELVHILSIDDAHVFKYNRMAKKIEEYVEAKEQAKKKVFTAGTETGRYYSKKPNKSGGPVTVPEDAKPHEPHVRVETYMHHELKCWPEYFAALKDGTKTFEYRINDRNFHVGDRLRISEWDPVMADSGDCPMGYTGDHLLFRVTYVLGDFKGLKTGYCVLGIKPWVNE
jgi:hypothetical protein